MYSSRGTLALLSVIALTLSACGPKSEPAKNAALYEVKGTFTKVTGKITLNGKIVDDGSIAIQLVAKDKLEKFMNNDIAGAPVSGAVGLKDGTYAVRTNKEGDGAPPGEYLLRFRYDHISLVAARSEDETPGGEPNLRDPSIVPKKVLNFNKKYGTPENFIPLTVAGQPVTKDLELTVDEQ